MDRETIRQSADTLASVLDEIEAGTLDASADQRAYIRGTLDTLKALIAE